MKKSTYDNSETPQANQKAYVNLIINDELAQESEHLQQFLNNNDSIQRGPKKIKNQAAQYPDQYSAQYPALNPLLQSIQAHYHNPQVEPTILAKMNKSFNCGQNRVFGLSLTSLWAAQVIFEFLFLYLLFSDFFIVISIPSILASIAIPLCSIGMKQSPPSVIQVLLFTLQLIISSWASLGLILVTYFSFGEQFMLNVILYELSLFVVMISAFVYLLIIKEKPNAVVLSIVSSIVASIVVSIVTTIKNNEIILEQFIIPIILCCSLSIMLGFSLKRVYNGKNKRVKKIVYWDSFNLRFFFMFLFIEIIQLQKYHIWLILFYFNYPMFYPLLLVRFQYQQINLVSTIINVKCNFIIKLIQSSLQNLLKYILNQGLIIKQPKCLILQNILN
ncbi:hypothetical protein pb186bvf_017985 [Paramecium bursaria]